MVFSYALIQFVLLGCVSLVSGLLQSRGEMDDLVNNIVVDHSYHKSSTISNLTQAQLTTIKGFTNMRGVFHLPFEYSFLLTFGSTVKSLMTTNTIVGVDNPLLEKRKGWGGNSHL